MIEKEQNKEYDNMLALLKKDVQGKDTSLNSIRSENDELIERVA